MCGFDIMTKQECIMPLSHVGEHLLTLGFGSEPTTNFLIIYLKAPSSTWFRHKAH